MPGESTVTAGTPERPTRRTGVWLVGGRGSVATTAVFGAAALRAGLAEPVGCVTERPGFPRTVLPGLDSLVFGGHDVVDTPLTKRAESLVEARVLPGRMVAAVEDALADTDREIRTGVACGLSCAARGTAAPHSFGEPGERFGGPQEQTVLTLADDIAEFRERRRLDQVVVVNVASTEPQPTWQEEYESWPALRQALRGGSPVLPASSLYACAAFLAGCAYVDFTPSVGARLPALHDLACERGLPYAGSDAKTGETLVQSVLAPMFADRALHVRAWSGTNLLGGGDGRTLADPAAALSKTNSKRRALPALLGHQAEGAVHIDHLPSLGEWKTAWDHILFEGFLGVPMTMQFTWQGCDSALAAPLVLDLARLAAAALADGLAGPLAALGFFFKDPVAQGPCGLAAQYEQLCAFAAGLAAGRGGWS
ncbi:inositol-3-phosphate synthase [Streptomyces sp. Inha503]|uniref:inositol-3-phosphate synthase n=1 Tax=Streptomyces sp. Inha503 TaxID=3383314 RepID=UPI0039A08BEA